MAANDSSFPMGEGWAVPKIPVSGLMEQLDISKPTLYNYLKHLSIEPVRQGKRAYISQPDYEKLVSLNSMLKNGKFDSVADAVKELRSRGVIIPKQSEEIEPDQEGIETRFVDNQGDQQEDVLKLNLVQRNFPSFLALGRAITSPLTESINHLGQRLTDTLRPAPPSPAAQQREIREYFDDAVKQSWKLTSSELAPLLKLSPSSISGGSFERIGYQFSKAGKSGRETLWKITKLE